MKPNLHSISIFLFLFFLGQNSFAQFSEGFEPYDKNRFGSFMTLTHELYVSASLGKDIEVSGFDLDTGNLGLGWNGGFGFGYDYRLGFYDYANSISIGVAANYFPGKNYKFQGILEVDLLGYGTDRFSIFALNELAWQINLDTGFGNPQRYSHIGVAELNIYGFSAQWLIQNDGPESDVYHSDEIFNLFRLKYIYQFE